MPPLVKQQISVGFGKPDQTKNPRTMLPGEMLEATNVVMTKEGLYEKRYGFGRTTYSFETAPGTPTDAIDMNGTMFMRDSNGVHHALDVPNSTWRTAGSDRRAMPNSIQLPQLLTYSKRPYLVKGAGNQVWAFWVGRDQAASSTDTHYQVVCIDYVTQVVYRPAAIVATAGIRALCPVYDSSSNAVWLFVAATGGILLHKFSTTTPTATSTNTTYTSGGVFVDSARDATSGEVIVVVTYSDTGPTHKASHSLLDKSTGLPKSSPAAVTSSYTANPTNNIMLSAPHILTHDGANGQFYYAFWEDSSTTNAYDVRLIEASVSTLTIASDSLVVTEANGLGGPATNPALGVVAGYRDATARWVFGQFNPNDVAQTVQSFEATTKRYQWNGSLASSPTVEFGDWLASGFVQLGSNYYHVTGFDDGRDEAVQRTYFLRDQNGTLLSKAFPMLASPEYHNPEQRGGSGGVVFSTNSSSFVPRPVFLDGGQTLIALAVLAKGTEPNTPLVNVLWFDLAATYGPPDTLPDDIVAYPGGIPFAVSKNEPLRELVPVTSPVGDVFIDTFGSLEANTRLISLVYRWRGKNGRLYRSAPSVPRSYTFRTASVFAAAHVLSYQHFIGGGTQWEIEVYLSALGGTGSLHLTYVVKNDPTLLRTRINTDNLANEFSTSNPVLYTEGEVLENEPMPSCRALIRWRERLHVSGTPTREEIWSSAELDADNGPRFHVTRRTFWSAGEGPVLGFGVNDWNYLSIFRANAIGVLSGPGPTPDGAGNYIVQTLTTEKGITDARSIRTTPFGLHFQNSKDGRVCAVIGREVRDVMQGGDDYRTVTVGASLYFEAGRQVWFYATDGRVLVRDLAFDRWYVWSSAGLLRGYAAALVGGVPTHLDFDSAVRRQTIGAYQDFTSGGATSTAMDLLTGDLNPLGVLQPFTLCQLDLLADCRSNGSFVVEVYADYDGATPEQHVQSMAAGVVQPWIMPIANSHDVGAVRVRFRESANSGAGILFAGFSMTIQAKGRTKMAKTGQRA